LVHNAIFKQTLIQTTETPTLKTQAKNVTKTYKTIALVTPYWRPGEDYVKQVINALREKVQNGDIVTVSEKAISTASGKFVDESTINAGSLARFLVKYWMRLAWGRVLGRLCHLRKKTIRRFKTYPIEEGSKHKQLALERNGFLQALLHGSEGGIDGSNMPYSLVSLPLRDAPEIADRLRIRIESELRRRVTVMIIDTDKTYTFRNFHFTPRPQPISGIQSRRGFFAYFFGRLLRLKRRATPIGISGAKMGVEEALEVSETANKVRGFGAGRNVWDMADKLKVSVTGVTWEMLDRIEHKPIVILRRK